MRYLMFVATDPENETDLTGEGTVPIDEWCDKNDAASTRIKGERIRPTDDATTVRRREGKVLVTDGPFGSRRSGSSDSTSSRVPISTRRSRSPRCRRWAASGRRELRPFWPLDESERNPSA